MRRFVEWISSTNSFRSQRARGARRFIHRAGDTRGTSVVEFAFVFPILMSLIFGIVEFGTLLTTDIALTNAARSATRWATTHPSAWSNSSSAPSNSIEGQLQGAGGAASIPNDDSHIQISYLVPGGGSPTPCGSYSAGSGSFSGANGYNQSTCLVPGSLIQVQVSYTYSFMTPVLSGLFPNGITLNTGATMLEEQ